jgi:hypothetical protein
LLVDLVLPNRGHRYDFDQSGTINSTQELKDLTTNTVFKLGLQIDTDDLDVATMKATAMYGDLDNDGIADQSEIPLDWTLNEFNAWFQVRACSCLLRRCPLGCSTP